MWFSGPNFVRPRTKNETLYVLDLPVLKLHGGRSSENINRDGNPSVGFVDSFHVAFEVLEGAFLDTNSVSNAERDRGFDLLFIFLVRPCGFDDPVDFSGNIGVGLPAAPVKSPMPPVSRTMNQVSSFSAILATM